MIETLRLSEASQQAASALAVFDEAALATLLARLELAVADEVAIQPEPAEAVNAQQHILAEILVATEQNIHVLRRLQERKAGNEWVR